MPINLPWWGDLGVALAAALVAWQLILKQYVWPATKGLWRFGHGFAQLVADFRDTGGFAGIASTIRDLAVDLSHVRNLAERADHELHPNRGESLRDSVTRVEGGIRDLREQVAAVTDQATAISERQEFLRAADESTAADLRRFLDTKYDAAMEANAHLRASVNELLAIEGDDDEPT